MQTNVVTPVDMQINSLRGEDTPLVSSSAPSSFLLVNGIVSLDEINLEEY
jgi:hypothetical protein